MNKSLTWLGIGLLVLANMIQAYDVKKIRLRLMNFTSDEFYNVRITDTPQKEEDKEKLFFDGKLEDQGYIELKDVNTRRLPLNIAVYEDGTEEPTELLIENVRSEGIRVEPNDLWVLYRDDKGQLQITEVDKQNKDAKVHGKNIRLVNFTPNEFYTVQVTDSSNAETILYDGRLEDQTWAELSTTSKMILPLQVKVWAGEDEPTKLLIKDVIKDGIRVGRNDIWVIFAGKDGQLQITSVKKQ